MFFLFWEGGGEGRGGEGGEFVSICFEMIISGRVNIIVCYVTW